MTSRLALAALLSVAGSAASAATLSGQVIDQGTLQPVAGATVTLYVPIIMGFPGSIASAETGSDGRYSVSVQRNGSLTAIAKAPGHAARAQDGTPCHDITQCFFASSMLQVSSSTSATADFSLPAAARLRGHAVDAASQLPASSAHLTLNWAGAPADAHLSQVYYPGQSGDFDLDGLHPGTYTVGLSGWSSETPALRLFDYRWPDQHCNDLQVSCDALTPGSLNLAPGQTQELTFALRRGAWLRSRMLSSGNTSAVYHSSLGHAQGRTLGSSFSEPSDQGARTYLGPLLPGGVKVALMPSFSLDYPAVVYPNLPCTGDPCDVSAAVAVDVPAAPGIYDLETVSVAPLRSISGRVTAAGSDAPIAGLRVSAGQVDSGIMSQWGFRASATTLTDSNGDYRLEALGAENFMLRTWQAGMPWIDQAWQSTPCISDNLFCHLYGGNYPRLTVAANEHLTGTNFSLQPGARIRGRAVYEGTGLPAARYAVTVIPSASALVSKPVYTDTDGNFEFGGLDPAGYFLFAASSLGNLGGGYGLLHPGQSCRISASPPQQDCDLSAAALLSPPAGGLIDDVIIVIPRDDSIFFATFDPEPEHP